MDQNEISTFVMGAVIGTVFGAIIGWTGIMIIAVPITYGTYKYLQY